MSASAPGAMDVEEPAVPQTDAERAEQLVTDLQYIQCGRLRAIMIYAATTHSDVLEKLEATWEAGREEREKIRAKEDARKAKNDASMARWQAREDRMEEKRRVKKEAKNKGKNVSDEKVEREMKERKAAAEARGDIGDGTGTILETAVDWAKHGLRKKRITLDKKEKEWFGPVMTKMRNHSASFKWYEKELQEAADEGRPVDYLTRCHVICWLVVEEAIRLELRDEGLDAMLAICKEVEGTPWHEETMEVDFELPHSHLKKLVADLSKESQLAFMTKSLKSGKWDGISYEWGEVSGLPMATDSEDEESSDVSDEPYTYSEESERDKDEDEEWQSEGEEDY